MIGFIEAVLLTGLVVLVVGSSLSLSTSAHWFIRSWDFPRVQIIVTAWLFTSGMWLCWEVARSRNDLFLWVAIIITVGLTGWHGFRIFPYTPIAPKQAVGTRNARTSVHHLPLQTFESSFRMWRWKTMNTSCGCEPFVALIPMC